MRGKNRTDRASAGTINAIRGGLRAAKREERKLQDGPGGVELQGIVRFKVARRALSCTGTQLRTYINLGWLQAWRAPGGKRNTGVFLDSLHRFLEDGRARAAAIRQAEAGETRAAG